jgi:ABC-2 type transport system permease protein
MNESAEVRAAASAPQSAARAAATQPMLTLLKREVWEHSALWIAPLVVTAALLIGAVFFRAYAPRTMPISIGDVAAPPQGVRAMTTTGIVVGFGASQYMVMSVVLWFYATACLYNERRDRSILFWKSMPVSDAKTVVSKMLIALAVVPLFVYVVTLLTTLVASGIFAIPRFSGPAPLSLWDGAAWVRSQVFTLVWLVIAVLWYAPLTAYLFLISAWARRNVQLWAILPPFIAIIVERIAFGTHYLSTWILYRLGPGWQSRSEQWFERLFTGPFYNASGGPSYSPGDAFSGMGPLRGFENIDLWLGLAVAAALLFAAARVRRYRDDTT